jgi:hypothetical protein
MEEHCNKYWKNNIRYQCALEARNKNYIAIWQTSMVSNLFVLLGSSREPPETIETKEKYRDCISYKFRWNTGKGRKNMSV